MASCRRKLYYHENVNSKMSSKWGSVIACVENHHHFLKTSNHALKSQLSKIVVSASVDSDSESSDSCESPPTFHCDEYDL